MLLPYVTKITAIVFYVAKITAVTFYVYKSTNFVLYANKETQRSNFINILKNVYFFPIINIALYKKLYCNIIWRKPKHIILWKASVVSLMPYVKKTNSLIIYKQQYDLNLILFIIREGYKKLYINQIPRNNKIIKRMFLNIAENFNVKFITLPSFPQYRIIEIFTRINKKSSVKCLINELCFSCMRLGPLTTHVNLSLGFTNSATLLLFFGAYKYQKDSLWAKKEPYSASIHAFNMYKRISVTPQTRYFHDAEPNKLILQIIVKTLPIKQPAKKKKRVFILKLKNDTH